MLNLTCRIAAVFLIIFGAQSIAPMGLALDYPPDATGGWGFDFAGANFAKKPGNDFFRYANGGWYDHVVIPADRSSIGPSVLAVRCCSLDLPSVARVQAGPQHLQPNASIVSPATVVTSLALGAGSPGIRLRQSAANCLPMSSPGLQRALSSPGLQRALEQTWRRLRILPTD
jgi:hypothetical protein